MALRESGVESVVTNISSLFLANEDIFVPHAIKRGLLNSGNGFVKKSSRPFRTGISSSVYQKSSADIFSMIENSFPIFPPRRDGWETLKVFFQETIPEEDAVSGAVIAIQSFGDFLGFNPHLHILCSDGCFYGEGMFRVAPRFETKQLEEIFPAKDGIFDRHNVFPAMRGTPFQR